MVKIYRFQRLMIAAAVIIWAVFAGRLVYKGIKGETMDVVCLLYTSPSPRD